MPVAYPASLPQPSYGSSLDDEIAVEGVEFGNGYEQVLREGPNNIRRMGKFTYSGVTEDQMKALRAFVRDLAGADTFTWQPPDEDILVTWRTGTKFSKKYKGFDNYDVSFDVKQVFNHA